MSFAADMLNYCSKIAPEWIEGITRKVIIETGSRAVMRSPVGDASYWQSPAPPGYAGGTFRRNWQYQYGNIASGILEGTDAGGGATISAIAQSSTGKAGVHYISNNLPYAQRIENGWSKRQAPQGIVSLIGMEFPDIVRIAQQ